DTHQKQEPYAEFVTTKTHKTLRGPSGGMILCKEKYAKQIDKSVFPGMQGGPFMHVIAAKATCLKEALSEDFKTYTKQIVRNAKTLGEELVDEGIRNVSDSKDNQLLLLDVTPLELTGRVAEEVLDKIGITTNKNTIPFDTESPFVTSGVRIGTAAVTTRGFKEEEMKEIASIISLTLKNIDNEEKLTEAEKRVASLSERFPLYE